MIPLKQCYFELSSIFRNNMYLIKLQNIEYMLLCVVKCVKNLYL
jgi:hypothetical protein